MGSAWAPSDGGAGVHVASSFSLSLMMVKGLFTVNAFLSCIFIMVSCDTKGHIVFQCSLSQ